MIVVTILIFSDFSFFLDNVRFVQRTGKKVVLKILMCRCYKEEFLAKGYEYKKKIIHFHCKCDKGHSYYVLFGKEHPYSDDFGLFVPRGGKSCTCKKGLAHQICGFCSSTQYLLNFKSFKICVGKLPGLFVVLL